MVNVNFKPSKEYVEKAFAAFDVLEGRKGRGNDFLGWMDLPSDTPASIVDGCCAIADEWRQKGVEVAVVIGIGGSYLGAKAASGTTTEPAVAFRIIKEHVEGKYGKAEAASRIVAVTDKARGALKSLSDQEGYRTFVIPDDVGGRFSVLTPVGLLPIAVAGYDIRALLRGAALLYAAARNELYDSGKKVEILVSYNPKLQYFGEWWKQLYGESEGKEGRGIFPASVNFTTDLHSMGQYIQEGERMLFETVISVEHAGRELTVCDDPQNLDGLNFLSGKHLEHCNRMAETGTRLAHEDGGVPNGRVTVERIDEFNLGELFFLFEKACGISAYMLGVNPFDQPGVEAYKKNMFALLGKPGYEAQAEAIRERLR